jgi:2Fe-2S ferredoxin
MQAALSGMVDDGILGECGGRSRCGTCHCYVDENWLNKLDGTSKLEAMILEGVIDPKKNSRLSCNIKITEELKGLVVHIPERQY